MATDWVYDPAEARRQLAKRQGESMDNALHKAPPITGYRDLTEAEVAAVNKVKALGVALGEAIDELQVSPIGVDPRWLAIGKTNLQHGIMDVVRAILKPTTF